jgi:hypothetical protein
MLSYSPELDDNFIFSGTIVSFFFSDTIDLMEGIDSSLSVYSINKKLGKK